MEPDVGFGGDDICRAAVEPTQRFSGERGGITADKSLVDLDYDYMNKNDVAFKEWWDKELKG